MLVTVAQSATGKHHFRCDGKLLWIGGNDEQDAIADFHSNFPEAIIREDYNPNQPRDARGRWTSGGGGGGGGSRKKSGGGGSGLLAKKVSELQKQAEELGIDVNSLSHKTRKSVLASAIEAKQKGKDLREAGLLKATKRKSSLSQKQRKPSPDDLPSMSDLLNKSKTLEGTKEITALSKALKVSEKEAAKIATSVHKWTGTREFQQIKTDARAGRQNPDLDNINKFIDRMQPYNGSIARGVKFGSEADRQEFLASIKNGMKLDSPSGFTKSVDVANDYAAGAFPVVLVAKNKSGVSIDKFSRREFEEEVLVKQGARYKLIGNQKQEGRTIYVEMKEI